MTDGSDRSTIATAGDRITDVRGIGVGHCHRIDDEGWATGTTVVTVSTPEGAPSPPVVAVDVRGGGPGTRETDLLHPSNTVRTAHAITLSGGSAYGLAAADGVMTALEDRGIGLAMDTDGHVVPIVPAAVIFDLPVGAWNARPDNAFGRHALAAASNDFEIGSVGAGAGARAGPLKGGVGTASETITGGPAAGVTVGALMVANPVGAVIDPATGLPWDAAAAVRHGLSVPDADEVAVLADLAAKATVLNTTIGVVATDAVLSKSSTHRMAMAAHDGLGRAIRPAHSPLDGDTVFAVATGAPVSDLRAAVTAASDASAVFGVPPGMNPDAAVLAEVCRVSAEVTERAIVSAVIAARSVAGVPTYRDVVPSAFRGRPISRGARVRE